LNITSPCNILTSGTIESRFPHYCSQFSCFRYLICLQILAYFQYSLRDPVTSRGRIPWVVDGRSLHILRASPDISDKGLCTNTKPSSWGLYNTRTTAFKGNEY
jgi:hypothetical protein